MNKRKLKKARKKMFCPLRDEFALLGYTDEERERAVNEYVRYCLKHYSYKHYRDSNAVLHKAMTAFVPPYPSNIAKETATLKPKHSKDVNHE